MAMLFGVSHAGQQSALRCRRPGNKTKRADMAEAKANAVGGWLSIARGADAHDLVR